MRSEDITHLRPQPPRKIAIPSAMLGMAIFIFSEIMLFTGMISAFLVARSHATVWPPPDQPRLPLEQTIFNTVLLLLSGVMLFIAEKYVQDRQTNSKGKLFTGLTLLFGTLFILLQGKEWVDLLSAGITHESGIYYSFFYLIIGMHALHATVALLFSISTYGRYLNGTLKRDSFDAWKMFWYFVVLLWPFLFVTVYIL